MRDRAGGQGPVPACRCVCMAKDGAAKKGKESAKHYGPAVVLKPVAIGLFVMLLLNAVLPVVLGGS